MKHISSFFSFIQLHKQQPLQNTIIGVILVFIILSIHLLFGSILLFVTQTPPTQDLGNAKTIVQQSTNTYVLVLALVFSAFTEEIIIRGVLLQWLKKHKGPLVAVLVSAFVFGLAHFSYEKSYVMVSAVIVGLLLGYVVVKTKSLLPSVVAHVGYNITILLIMII